MWAKSADMIVDPTDKLHIFIICVLYSFRIFGIFRKSMFLLKTYLKTKAIKQFMILILILNAIYELWL